MTNPLATIVDDRGHYSRRPVAVARLRGGLFLFQLPFKYRANAAH